MGAHYQHQFTYLSIESVLQFMNPNLRILMSSHSPAIRNCQTTIPLRINHLHLGTQFIKVNNTEYRVSAPTKLEVEEHYNSVRKLAEINQQMKNLQLNPTGNVKDEYDEELLDNEAENLVIAISNYEIKCAENNLSNFIQFSKDGVILEYLFYYKTVEEACKYFVEKVFIGRTTVEMLTIDEFCRFDLPRCFRVNHLELDGVRSLPLARCILSAESFPLESVKTEIDMEKMEDSIFTTAKCLIATQRSLWACRDRDIPNFKNREIRFFERYIRVVTIEKLAEHLFWNLSSLEGRIIRLTLGHTSYVERFLKWIGENGNEEFAQEAREKLVKYDYPIKYTVKLTRNNRTRDAELEVIRKIISDTGIKFWIVIKFEG